MYEPAILIFQKTAWHSENEQVSVCKLHTRSEMLNNTVQGNFSEVNAFWLCYTDCIAMSSFAQYLLSHTLAYAYCIHKTPIHQSFLQICFKIRTGFSKLKILKDAGIRPLLSSLCSRTSERQLQTFMDFKAISTIYFHNWTWYAKFPHKTFISRFRHFDYDSTLTFFLIWSEILAGHRVKSSLSCCWEQYFHNAHRALKLFMLFHFTSKWQYLKLVEDGDLKWKSFFSIFLGVAKSCHETIFHWTPKLECSEVALFNMSQYLVGPIMVSHSFPWALVSAKLQVASVSSFNLISECSEDSMNKKHEKPLQKPCFKI